MNRKIPLACGTPDSLGWGVILMLLGNSPNEIASSPFTFADLYISACSDILCNTLMGGTGFCSGCFYNGGSFVGVALCGRLHKEHYPL